MSKGRRRRKSKAQTGPKAPRQPLLSIRVTVTCWTGTYRRIGGPPGTVALVHEVFPN